MRVILAIAALAASTLLLAVAPQHKVVDTERGHLLVFPGDSLDLSLVTFTIDGDTVSRDSFFTLCRDDIRTLSVTPAPANLVEVTTRAFAMRPLLPEELPDDIEYVIDGKAVDRVTFTSLPADDIISLVMVRAARPRIEITTRASTLTTND